MFKALHALAQRNTLTMLVSAEGEQLRVMVFPKASKSGKTVVPLSILGTPEELDADFVEAVETYAAPAMSVLEQAQATAKQIEAPASKDSELAKPAKAAAKPAETKKSGSKTAAAAKKAKPEPAAPAVQAAAETPPQPEKERQGDAPAAEAPNSPARKPKAKAESGSTPAALNPADAWPFPTPTKTPCDPDSSTKAPDPQPAQSSALESLSLELDGEEIGAAPESSPPAVIEVDLF